MAVQVESWVSSNSKDFGAPLSKHISALLLKYIERSVEIIGVCTDAQLLTVKGYAALFGGCIAARQLHMSD